MHTSTHRVQDLVVHSALFFTSGSCDFSFQAYAVKMTWTLCWDFNSVHHNELHSFSSFCCSPRAFEGNRNVGTRLSGLAGRHLLMGMAIESVRWCRLLACCALLDSHFLTNLTCLAFCYLTRTSCLEGRLFTECQGGILSPILQKGIKKAQCWFILQGF